MQICDILLTAKHWVIYSLFMFETVMVVCFLRIFRSGITYAGSNERLHYVAQHLFCGQVATVNVCYFSVQFQKFHLDKKVFPSHNVD